MDLKSLKNNIIDSVKTTNGPINAVKRLFWLYNGFGRLGDQKIHKTQIEFKFPPPVGGISLMVRNNDGADGFIMSEVFHVKCYSFSSKENILHILDLGANAGFTAIYFSRLFPEAKIVCVEPMPNNIAILKQNLSLNNVDSVVIEAAATVEDGEITMDIGDKDYGNKIHDMPFGKIMNVDTLVVDGLSINTILKKLSWEKVDLVKIDIEGYEAILLSKNNNWLSKVGAIILEIHEGVSIEMIKEATSQYGFLHSRLRKGNWILSKTEII